MSSALTKTIPVISLEDTLALAASIGMKLRGGETIELVSDLGGGKTAFVRGLAAGMGSVDMVHSPSFTLRNEYRAADLTLYHFDFYRLNEPGIMTEELEEVVNDPLSVVAVEWADIVENVLPLERLVIVITATGETERRLVFTYPSSLAYLLA
jgi:tRNA threonylcarbamoyladenosine biosynthesis protein TsaE